MALAAKSGNPSSIPLTYVMEEETDKFSTSLHICAVVQACAPPPNLKQQQNNTKTQFIVLFSLRVAVNSLLVYLGN